jgi:hypothetical protein
MHRAPTHGFELGCPAAGLFEGGGDHQQRGLLLLGQGRGDQSLRQAGNAIEDQRLRLLQLTKKVLS